MITNMDRIMMTMTVTKPAGYRVACHCRAGGQQARRCHESWRPTVTCGPTSAASHGHRGFRHGDS